MSVRRKLFGGAIEADMPREAIDVSDFRQVPDNQEVFLLEQGEIDKSIIVELLEQPSGDVQQALRTHLSDLLDIEDVGPVECTTVANAVLEHSYLTVYTDKVTTIVALIRLNKVHTDILVSINAPAGRDYSLDIRVMEQIVRSLEVTDWRLFG